MSDDFIECVSCMIFSATKIKTVIETDVLRTSHYCRLLPLFVLSVPASNKNYLCVRIIWQRLAFYVRYLDYNTPLFLVIFLLTVFPSCRHTFVALRDIY